MINGFLLEILPNETNFRPAALAAAAFGVKLVADDKAIALATIEDESTNSARFVIK
ncbi:hypothetical protein [Paraburkholderia sp. BR13444]|uniref:hypothetical protein n=1 Tax=Paraburkholderia sp. BR13444 TaxID=3236997 RepID=UPI0034CE87F1